MKKKAFIISLIAVAVITAATLTPALVMSSTAYWTGEGGENAYAPDAKTDDWNDWVKYFEVDASGRIISYSGTNRQEVIFPKSIPADGGTAVTAVSSGVFSDTTLKSLPVTMKIAPTITVIEASAFQNLINLGKVTFGSAGSTEGGTCTIEAGAFAGCNSLKDIYLYGNGAGYTFGPNSLLGCSVTIRSASGKAMAGAITLNSDAAQFKAITGAANVTYAAL